MDSAIGPLNTPKSGYTQQSPANNDRNSRPIRLNRMDYKNRYWVEVGRGEKKDFLGFIKLSSAQGGSGLWGNRTRGKHLWQGRRGVGKTAGCGFRARGQKNHQSLKAANKKPKKYQKFTGCISDKEKGRNNLAAIFKSLEGDNAKQGPFPRIARRGGDLKGGLGYVKGKKTKKEDTQKKKKGGREKRDGWGGNLR